MEPLRFGIIGCGGRGTAVAKLMAKMAGVHVVAVCDVVRERADRVGQELGVPAFSDYEEMLERVDMDAVFIATPVDNHFAPAKTAIMHGKHVILEKAMTARAKEAWELVRLAETRGICGVVSYQLRFHPVFLKWWEIAQDLSPLFVVSSRHTGIMPPIYLRPELWSGIIDYLTHDIDLVLWVMGREPESVYATASRKAMTGTETTEILCIQLHFGDGIGLVYGGMGGWGIPSRHLVLGRQGNVHIATGGIESTRFSQTERDHYERERWQPKEPVGDTTDRLIHHFSRWVQGKGESFPLATFESGLQVMVVHEAVWESLKTGQVISLEPLRQRLFGIP